MTGAAVSDTGDATSRMLARYQAEMDRETKAAIKVVDDLLKKEEAKNAKLTDQLSAITMDMAQLQKDMQRKIDITNDTHKKETGTKHDEHCVQMQKMQKELDAAYSSLADERKASAGMEEQRNGYQRSCAHLEKVVEKLQAAKPVAPAAVVVKPQMPSEIEYQVRRDSLGNISSIIAKPSRI